MPTTRLALVLGLPVLLASCTAGTRLRPGFSERLAVDTNVHGGLREVDHEPFEDHPVAGLEVVLRPVPGWLSYELGGTFGQEEADDGAVEVDGDFYEAYAGLRASWHRGPQALTPYLGVGGSYAQVDREVTGPGGIATEEDWSGGGYVRTGVTLPLGRIGFDDGTTVLLGVDVRAVFGQDYDWVQGTLFLGFGKPLPTFL